MATDTTLTAPISQYMTNLITEKGHSINADLDREGHIGLTYEHLIEFIVSMPTNVQIAVRDMCVMIDFHNGNVFDYFDYLINGMVEARGLDKFI
jgi:hypothetical protein